jgi:hypothetical protein
LEGFISPSSHFLLGGDLNPSNPLLDWPNRTSPYVFAFSSSACSDDRIGGWGTDSWDGRSPKGASPGNIASAVVAVRNKEDDLGVVGP